MEKEIHTPVGPIHATITILELSLAANYSLQVSKQGIELGEVLPSGHITILVAGGLFVFLTGRAIQSIDDRQLSLIGIQYVGVGSFTECGVRSPCRVALR